MDPLSAIHGDSASVHELRRYIPKVAQSHASVLITGETGTGKELVAAAVHQLSDRCDAPFVAVNCAALPEGLIETELFGHQKGAFSGATNHGIGKAAEADGGTLFLDEIGEMTMFGQAKLLRFLETGAMDRIGSPRPVPVDIRIVAATNQHPEDLISQNKFRADLYYRLNVARIEIDPLRDRPSDIATLINWFTAQMNDQFGLAVQPPDADLQEVLQNYDWPGNVRELRNMVEAIFIDPPEGRLTFSSLPSAFQRLMAGHQVSMPDERIQLVTALKCTNWNKTEAARMLNISRMSIYRKIDKYHLNQSTPRTK